MKFKILLMLALMVTNVVAQYQITSSPGGYSWVDISATGNSFNPADDNQHDIVLGTPVWFGGNSSVNLRVGNNGAILFNQVAGSIDAINREMTHASTPDLFIAPFWDDLDNNGGTIYYGDHPTDPDKYVITWSGISHFDNIGAATFQVILSESSNDMVFQYQDMDFGNSQYSYGASATVGVRRTSAKTTQYSYNASVISNSTALLVTYINHPPVLNTGLFPKLNPIDEGILLVANGGTTVNDVINGVAPGDLITDSDGDPEGIVIIDADETNGTWSYSINSGGAWNNIAPVAANNALALTDGATNMIRFQPSDADWNGTATITIRAWDQTTSTNDTRVDASTVGGNTAYSSQSMNVSITVNNVNDAPVLDNSGAPAWVNVDEDDTSHGGETVAAIIAKLGGTGITDIDSDPEGIAIINANNLNGYWQYTTGGQWYNLGNPSSTAARLLSTTASLRFLPDADFNGNSNADMTFRAWDQTSSEQNGQEADITNNYGTGTTYPFSSNDETTGTVTVNAVNDAPVITVPGALTMNEDATQAFVNGGPTEISVADVDIAAGDVEVDLSVSNGALSLSGIAGLAFTVGDGTDDVAMTFTGTPANVNNALDNMVYTPTGDYYGSETLTVQCDDQGNTGSGGAQSTTETVTITVSNVNDAPVLDNSGNPVMTAIDEDVSAASNTGTSVSAIIASLTGTGGGITDNDPTDPQGIAVTTVNNTNGVWEFSINGGSSWNTLNPAAASSARLLASSANSLIRFLPNADYNGVVDPAIAFNAWDQSGGSNGGTGDASSGGAATPYSTASETAAITVNTVNDAPVIQFPASQSINEEQAITFNAGNSNLISLSDSDAGGNDVDFFLTCSKGVLTLSGVAGLTTVNGDGTASIDVRGPMADINNALDGMTYQANLNQSGGDYLILTADDLGNSGGAAETTMDTVSILITNINDAPVLTLGTNPTFTAIDEDSPGNGTLITDLIATLQAPGITDADGDAPGVAVISATDQNGAWQWSLDQTTWHSFSSAPPAETQARLLPGDGVAAIRFNPSSGYSGSATGSVTFRAWDETSSETAGQACDITNNYGTGGSHPFSANSIASNSITVNAVNDPPVNSVPGSVLTTNEDTPLVLQGANLVSISDPDAGANPVNVTLIPDNGTVTLSQITGLTLLTGSGADDALCIFQGSIVNINSALDGMSFQPSSLYYGAASLVIQTDDGGYTGSGGIKSDRDTIDITVQSVNSAPTLVTNNPLAVSEGESGSISHFLLECDDLDNTDAEITYEITVLPVNGKLYEQSVELGLNSQFTQEDLNLNRLSYHHDSTETGNDGFTFTVSDGAGGSVGATVFNITIQTVNDTPVQINLDTLRVKEDSAEYLDSLILYFEDEEQNSSQLIFTVDDAPSFGTLSLNSNPLAINDQFTARNILDSALVYQHDGAENSADLLIVTLSDGNGAQISQINLPIKMIPFNEAPVITLNDTLSVEEGDSVLITTANLMIEDPDDADSSVSIIINDTFPNGLLRDVQTLETIDNSFTVRRLSQGRIRYVHSGNETVLDSLGFYALDDGGAVSDTLYFYISVSPANDAPSANNMTIAVLEDSSVMDTLEAFDPEGDTLVYKLSNNPASGQVALDSLTGAFTYTPNADYYGNDAFDYYARDGNVNSEVRTVFVTITDVNDPPTFELGDSIVVDEDQKNYVSPSWASAISSGPANENGQELTFYIITDSASFFEELPTMTASGTLRFSLNDNFNGSTNIRIYLKDSGGTLNGGENGSDTLSSKIVINAVNDPPVFSSEILPDDGAKGVPQSLTVQWNCEDVDNEFISYDFYYRAGQAVFNTINGKDLTEEEYKVTNLDPGTVYYWKVVAKDGADSTESDVFSFTTEYDMRFTAPIENEVLRSGETYRINWDIQTNPPQRISLYYSSDNGGNYHLIDKNINNGNYYDWQVPDLERDYCYLKIEDSDNPNTYGISPRFKIRKRYLELVYPNGGEVIEGGDEIQVKVNTFGLENSLKFYLSLTQQDQFNSINPVFSSSLSGDKEWVYLWEVPGGIASKFCKIKVDGVFPHGYSDMSDSCFTILEERKLDLIQPNGGEAIAAGGNYEIKWKSGGSIGKVGLAYSLDNSKTYEIISSETDNDGIYQWTVPDEKTDLGRVKIWQATDGGVFDVSQAAFSVVKNSFAFYSPKQGEYHPGESIQIQWETFGNIDQVNLYFISENGGAKRLIKMNHENNGEYPYTLPYVHSENCQIQITASVDPSIQALSEVFSVLSENPDSAVIISPPHDTLIFQGEALYFSGSAPQQENPEYLWEWNDGNKNHVQNPGWIFFPQKGVKTVDYSFVIDGKTSLKDTRTIEIDELPSPSIVTPDGGVTINGGDSVSFLGKEININRNIEYYWRINGINGSGLNWDYQFDQPGVYQVEHWYKADTLTSRKTSVKVVVNDETEDYELSFTTRPFAVPFRGGVVVDWETNIPCSGSVKYGVSSGDLNSVSTTEDEIIKQTVLVTSLNDGKYYYQVEIHKGDKTRNSAVYSFQISEGLDVDTIPPVLIKKEFHYSNRNALVLLEFSEPVKVVFMYGENNNLLDRGVYSSSYEKKHGLLLSELDWNETYYYKIIGTDIFGNTTNNMRVKKNYFYATEDTFEIPINEDLSPPVFLGPPEIFIHYEGNLGISWKSNEPAKVSCQVIENNMPITGSTSNQHAQEGVCFFQGLKENKVYIVEMKLMDISGNMSEKTMLAAVLNDEEPVIPNITEGPTVLNVNGGSLIQWTISAPGISYFEYGKEESFLDRMVQSNAWTQDKNVYLSKDWPLFSYRIKNCAYPDFCGTWSDIFSTSVDVAENTELIFNKEQAWNYPNPFQSKTTLIFNVNQPENVKIEIFNALGQKVHYNSVFVPKGPYHYIWPRQISQNYPSGLYFYKITGKSNTFTGKMLLMK